MNAGVSSAKHARTDFWHSTHSIDVANFVASPITIAQDILIGTGRGPKHIRSE